jgi:predicted RNA-binding protein with TRAM domain
MTTNELPVKVGDTVDLKVFGLGRNGDLMVKVERYIIFVKMAPDVKLRPGMTVKVRITKTLPSYGFAELIA